MFFTLHVLKDYLEGYYSEITAHVPRPYPIVGMRLYSAGKATKPGHVYVYKKDDFTDMDEVSQDTQYLLIGQPNDRFVDANYLCMPADTDVNVLINHISDFFDKYLIWEKALFQSVAADKSIQELVDFSLPIFENPILVYDTSFKLLNTVPLDYIKLGEYWEPSPEHAYLNEKTMQIVRNSGFLRRMEEDSSAFFFYNLPSSNEVLGGTVDVLACKIQTENRNLGYLHVPLVKNPISQFHLQLAETLAFCVAQVLEQQLLSESENHPFDTFFSDMCTDKNVSYPYLSYQLNRLGWKKHDKYSVMVIKVNTDKQDPIKNKALFRYVAKQVFTDFQITVIENAVVVITHGNTFQSLDKNMKKEFQFALGQNGLKCGCSMEFDYFPNIPSYYIQASVATDMQVEENAFNPVSIYENYFPMHLIQSFSSNVELEHFVHPIVRLIAKHDFEHNGNLLGTLNSYFINDRSHASCCKELFIHKSTLQYRLNKIREIAGEECFNPKNKLSILLSILLINSKDINHHSIKKAKEGADIKI